MAELARHLARYTTIDEPFITQRISEKWSRFLRRAWNRSAPRGPRTHFPVALSLRIHSCADACMIHWLNGILILFVAASGCATAGGRSGGSCTAPPSAPLVPFPPSRAIGLAGTYDIVLVADLGPRVGDSARGVIHLAKTDTLHRYYINAFGQGSRRNGDRPLFGWGELHGDIGLMTAGTPLASRDSAVPGVVASLDSLRGGLRFMLGYRLMLDGGFNELTVTSSDAAGFAGRWESSAGPTTYRAAGYFCARRRASDD